jgi:beta-1,4-mannosyl-glycoprotein beta-1,4-N-acetylglucosaminyltransferase
LLVKKFNILDSFPFNNELDILEIRLNELIDVIDFHIIVESKYNQVGNKKELYYQQNKKRFKKFHHKIIHIIVNDIPSFRDTKDLGWKNENHVRNCIQRGFSKIPYKLEKSDILVVKFL